jgi:hypothetical protein
MIYRTIFLVIALLSPVLSIHLGEIASELCETPILSPIFSDCQPGTYISGPFSCSNCEDGYISGYYAEHCEPCEEGTYSNDDHTVCETCLDGFYSQEGSSTCTRCKLGFISSIEHDRCLPCPDGYESNAHQNHCKPCKKGFYADEGEMCHQCPLGTFSDTKAEKCSPCNAGSESSLHFDHCVSCQSGFYSHLSSMCQPCHNGTVSGIRSDTCDTCSRGTFATSDRSQCLPCSPGTYSDIGSDTCTPCRNGTISGIGNFECMTCAPGTVAYNHTTCVPCTAGSFSNIDATQCIACEPGYISGNGSSACYPCEPGTYMANNFTCVACEAGTYSGGFAATQCYLCPNGFTSKVKADKCDLCSAGTFTTDHITCDTCQNGTYSPNAASTCYNCSAGTYTTDHITCPNCEPGTISFYGASTCTDCQAGTFAIYNTACLPCDHGSVSKSKATVCTQCKAGTHAIDNTVCEACKAGTYSHDGFEECLPCPGNSHSGVGASKCTSCHTNELFNQVKGICETAAVIDGLSVCPGGTYVTAGNECISCLAGNFSKAGDTNCTVCPKGYISNDEASVCTQCGEDTYTVDNLECVNCPAGNHSGKGYSSCFSYPTIEAASTVVEATSLASAPTISSDDLKKVVKWIQDEVAIISTPYCNRGKYYRPGIVPSKCYDGEMKLGALCYPNCGPNQEVWGLSCCDKCPDGYFGSTTNTCQNHPSDGLKTGGICPAGYGDFTWYCYRGWLPDKVDKICPPGYAIGFTGCECCRVWLDVKWRNSYGIGNSHIPFACSDQGYTNTDGLCHPPPNPGYSCIGIGCKENCPKWTEVCGGPLGDGCSPSQVQCASAITQMFTNVGLVLINVLSLGTASEFTAIAKMAAMAKKIKDMKEIETGINVAAGGNQIALLIKDAIKLSETTLAGITSPAIESVIDCFYPRGTPNYNQIAQAWAGVLIAATLKADGIQVAVFIASVIDPTGIIGLWDAFNNPACTQHTDFPITPNPKQCNVLSFP